MRSGRRCREARCSFTSSGADRHLAPSLQNGGAGGVAAPILGMPLRIVYLMTLRPGVESACRPLVLRILAYSRPCVWTATPGPAWPGRRGKRPLVSQFRPEPEAE